MIQWFPNTSLRQQEKEGGPDEIQMEAELKTFEEQQQEAEAAPELAEDETRSAKEEYTLFTIFSNGYGMFQVIWKL